MITSSLQPQQLLSIQGDDLKSKYSFLRSTMPKDFRGFIDVEKVFDSILEVAANENLKPGQMIKKVFLFTNHATSFVHQWETKYEAIGNKFKDGGYPVPHILFWGISGSSWPWMPPTQHPGATLLSGWSDDLVKYFFENGGEIGAHHLMEAAISHEDFQINFQTLNSLALDS